MNKGYNIFTLIILSITSYISVYGQFTEDFEGEVGGSNTFMSESQSFTTGINWLVKNSESLGFEGSDFYINNDSNCGSGKVGSISTTDGTDIYFVSLWLYTSNNCNVFDFLSGSVRVFWFKDGVEQHKEIYTVDTGFPSPFNGYQILNFNTDKNVCIEADSLVFETFGFDYLALDQLTWVDELTQPSISDIETDEDTVCAGTEMFIIANNLQLGSAGEFTWRDKPNGGGNVLGTSAVLNSQIDSTITFYAYVDACESFELSKTIFVPKANITDISVSDDSICAGETSVLTANGINLANGSFSWQDAPNGTGNAISSMTELSVSPELTMTYYGRQVGCDTAELAQTIHINETDTDFTLSSSHDSICSDIDVLLEANGLIVNDYDSFVWRSESQGNGSILGTDTMLTVSPDSSTTYFARIEGCDTAEVAITIFGNRINTNITLSGDELTSLAIAEKYQWLDCDENNAFIDGATSNVYLAQETGNYSVIIEDKGCIDTSACTEIIVTNIFDLNGINTIDFYPNPVNNQLILNLNSANMVEISISDALGNEILTQQIEGNSAILNLSDLVSGVYSLTIYSDKKKATKRFIKR